MKTKNAALTICVVLLSITTVLNAEPQSTDTRAYIGVSLDTAPLPDLLIVHMGLSPNQGVRIKNVQSGSPADKAGLERDDIIISFQGKKIENFDFDKFVDQVQEAGVDTEVSLGIIHQGKRKNIKLKLEPRKDEIEPKYPPEPDIIQSWKPGKIFRLKPGDKDWKDWTEIVIQDPETKVKANLDKMLKSFTKQMHHSTYHTDGETYSITIEGDPDDENATIRVSIGNTEYKTIVKEIDKLPEKYRKLAEDALKNIKKSSEKSKSISTEIVIPDSDKIQKILVNKFKPDDKFNYRIEEHIERSDEEVLKKIEKQMEKLQQRIDELEKRLGEVPERSSGKIKQEKQPQRTVKKIQLSV
ncbi:MAG: PDZ domain-containing protein [Phycisphaerales bacterium]|jgi:membrane-associated protease RseP (regulator of RpoE activity)